ncbi:MAG TPA: hypothetical protein VGM92_10010 [Candidatus Kapabacteria bacterium]|jgi:hypothetical protein
MKTTLVTLILTLSLGFASTSNAQLSGGSASFIISNQQSLALGTVTVTAPNGFYDASVPASANDTVVMTSDTVATSITINGQTVPEGIKAIVMLPGGAQIAVLWLNPLSIVVIDNSELQ